MQSTWEHLVGCREKLVVGELCMSLLKERWREMSVTSWSASGGEMSAGPFSRGHGHCTGTGAKNLREGGTSCSTCHRLTTLRLPFFPSVLFPTPLLLAHMGSHPVCLEHLEMC